MRTQAAVISALFATTQAINIRQLGFLKAQEQLNGPAVGNEHPRFCDLGATSASSNDQGCVPDSGYFANTLRSAPRAVANPPIGGNTALNYNHIEPTLAPAHEPRQAERNESESPNGSVYIPFAYVQIRGDANPSPVDPSKAATQDPIERAAQEKAEAEKVQRLSEGNEHEQEKIKPDPEAQAKVEKEEAQSKAQGQAVKVLHAAEAAPAEPLEKDNKQPWDLRGANDAARVAADRVVASQQKDEAQRVSENKAAIDKATGEVDAHNVKVGKERENVSANSWHEYWVTKVVPQPTPDDYGNHFALRKGPPSQEDKDNAKANGPSKQEEDKAKEGLSLIQLRDPSLADQQEAEYQVVYDKEQKRLHAAEAALKAQIQANEEYRHTHAVTLLQMRNPSLADQQEAEYKKVYDKEQARLHAAEAALASQIAANEEFRRTHAVTLVQKRNRDPSLADQQEAEYQVVYDKEQARLHAAEAALKAQIQANEEYRHNHAVTL